MNECVKAETKLSCSLGFMACDGRIVCMCDWNCDCSNCADEPPSCFKDGGSSAQLGQSQFQSHIHTHNPSITSHESLYNLNLDKHLFTLYCGLFL